MEEETKNKIMKLFRELHKLRLEDIRDEEWPNLKTIRVKQEELFRLLADNPLGIKPYFRGERDPFGDLSPVFIRVFEYSGGNYRCIRLYNVPDYLRCEMETVGITDLCNSYYPITQKAFMNAYNKMAEHILSKVNWGCDTENQKNE